MSIEHDFEAMLRRVLSTPNPTPAVYGSIEYALTQSSYNMDQVLGGLNRLAQILLAIESHLARLTDLVALDRLMDESERKNLVARIIATYPIGFPEEKTA